MPVFASERHSFFFCTLSSTIISPQYLQKQLSKPFNPTSGGWCKVCQLPFCQPNDNGLFFILNLVGEVASTQNFFSQRRIFFPLRRNQCEGIGMRFIHRPRGRRTFFYATKPRRRKYAEQTSLSTADPPQSALVPQNDPQRGPPEPSSLFPPPPRDGWIPWAGRMTQTGEMLGPCFQNPERSEIRDLARAKETARFCGAQTLPPVGWAGSPKSVDHTV